ncbi:hypothetical protein AAY473_000535 [Plecturocebus cupreus]
MGFHCVAQAGLKLLTFSNLPTLASQSARIQGIRQSTDLQKLPRFFVKQGPGDYLQRSHMGRQRDSFGWRSCFASAPWQRFSVLSIRDGLARLVPSPQGEQQLEALRTETFTASPANPGRSGSVGNGHPPKEN